MPLHATSGFTMVETITVLVILGILSATAVGIYQHIGESEFSERLLLKTNLRYARQRAMDSTVNWGLSFSGSSYTLEKAGVSGETFPSVEAGTHASAALFTAPAHIEFVAQSGESTAASTQSIVFEAGSTVAVYSTGAIP